MSAPATRSRDIPLDVIVLNGPSSAGKTTLAAALQDVFDETWLVFGIDTLISALPLALLEIHRDASIGARPRDHEVRPGGIRFDADGAITVGSEFRRLETAWLKGLSVLAGAGVHLILDAVFLDGSIPKKQSAKPSSTSGSRGWASRANSMSRCNVNVTEATASSGMSARTAPKIFTKVCTMTSSSTRRSARRTTSLQEIANHLRASTL